MYRLGNLTIVLPSYKCDKACPFCIAKNNRKFNDSEAEHFAELSRILDVMRINGIRFERIVLSGNGEPSLYGIETLKELEGLIDIYLPDLKYYSNELSKKYSKVDNYFDIATKAIQEMNRQVGRPTFNEKGIIQKGMMIRHLILPNHLQNTKHILKWIKESMPAGTYVSVMAQYFPTYQAKQDESINRKLTKKEYQEIENYLYILDLENGYIQELGEHEEEYVPNFDLSE